MKLLALDLGTRTGWALWDGHRLESGVETFEAKRGESPGMRFLKFNRWLEVFFGELLMLDLVVYEAPHHRGGAPTEIAYGFATRIQERCALLGIEHVSVHTATLKKWTTGRGNADKAAMMEAVARRWNRRVDSDDEADAIALAYYALETLVPAGGK
jgi:hypothetical protein